MVEKKKIQRERVNATKKRWTRIKELKILRRIRASRWVPAEHVCQRRKVK